MMLIFGTKERPGPPCGGSNGKWEVEVVQAEGGVERRRYAAGDEKMKAEEDGCDKIVDGCNGESWKPVVRLHACCLPSSWRWSMKEILHYQRKNFMMISFSLCLSKCFHCFYS